MEYRKQCLLVQMEQRSPLFWGVLMLSFANTYFLLQLNSAGTSSSASWAHSSCKATHYPWTPEPPQQTSKQAAGFQRLKTLKFPHWCICCSSSNKIKSSDSHRLCITASYLHPLAAFSHRHQRDVNGIMGKHSLQYYSSPSCFCFQTTERPSGCARIANIKEVLINSWHKGYIL